MLNTSFHRKGLLLIIIIITKNLMSVALPKIVSPFDLLQYVKQYAKNLFFNQIFLLFFQNVF